MSPARSTRTGRTTFRTDSGVATITDFMPLLENTGGNAPMYRAIYRNVECIEGRVELAVEFAPRFDYARVETPVEPIEEGALASSDMERVLLSVPESIALDIENEGESDGDSENTASATHTLQTGESGWYVCQYGMRAPTDPTDRQNLLDRTTEYWRDWAHNCDREDCPFAGAGHDLVVRSGRLIELLTYKDTGAIAAAPTTSLPEVIGGVRNWDYRYSWIRDGAFTVQALTNLGHTEEATAYLDRFLELSRSSDPAEIKPIYVLEHDATLEEEELEHFEGYEESSPVRIGNEASGQLQLDVYGELVLAIYQYAWSDQELSLEDWVAMWQIVEFVCENWKETDAGIWEVRGEPSHVVHSKVMCWVALDRALALADEGGFDAPVERWESVREEIRETTLDKGFDESIGEQGSFTQTFAGDALDATGLSLPMSGFIEWDDPRTQGTIEAIRTHLTTEEGLVYRYRADDGLPGGEGAFLLCSFWLIDALALSGRLEEARELFDSILEYASPLGLLSEDVDPETGRLLRNFPQAFSHIGLVNSALYLKEAEESIDVQPFTPPDTE